MSNPLTAGNPAQSQMNPQEMISKLKSDPVGMLKQAGYNVPESIAQDPGAMIQHLMQSGQIPQSRLQSIMQRFGRR